MTDEQAKEIKRRIRWRIIEAAFENALLFDKIVESLYKSSNTDGHEEELSDIIDNYDSLRQNWYENIGENPNELDAIVRSKLRMYYNRHRGENK